MSSKTLRFASIIRVSTERQEQKGESLVVQTKSNQRDVERLGGNIVAVYGGQEHATKGFERKELERFLSDAAKNKFDAVIVLTPDRWSRDNSKSKEGLEVLRQYGIKFFVGAMEFSLFDPQHCFILGMNAEVGELIASQQLKKGLESKIERAAKGLPASGGIPFGRTFDKKTGTWGINPDKQFIVTDSAERFLAGESLTQLAKKHGLTHSYLCRVLREKCSDTWQQKFHCPKLNISETVPTTVPRLLPEKVIKAVQQRLQARRTFLHGKPRVHDYLLNGMVFCSECGLNLTGQISKGGRFYRHAHHDWAKECTLIPRPWIKAEKIENEVFDKLFSMFGNPSAIHRAIKQAVPDADESIKRRKTIQEELDRIEKARNRILSMIEKELISDFQAENKLGDLKIRENNLKGERETLDELLESLPSEEELKLSVERFGSHLLVVDEELNQYQGGNDVCTFINTTWEDKKALFRAVFGARLPDGKPAGVYVSPGKDSKPYRPKNWEFNIRGRLDFEVVMQCTGLEADTQHNTLKIPQKPKKDQYSIAPVFILTGVA